MVHFRRLVALAAVFLAPLAQAAPTQFNTNNVTIDFDPEGFAFSRDVGGFGGFGSEEIPPSSLLYTQVNSGVKLDFNGLMSLYATSYYDYSPQSLAASFNAYFGFTPDAGYQITGYTITYEGGYGIETPGSVSLGAPGVNFYQSSSGESFNIVANIAGPNAPSLAGGLGATGDIQYIQVFDGYEDVFSHYEDVLDYCEVENPDVCYYHQEPVYNQVAVYHDEMDLGEANINLQSITIQAQVAAVPEPGVLGLLMGAMPVAGWWLRRRKG